MMVKGTILHKAARKNKAGDTGGCNERYRFFATGFFADRPGERGIPSEVRASSTAPHCVTATSNGANRGLLQVNRKRNYASSAYERRSCDAHTVSMYGKYFFHTAG